MIANFGNKIANDIYHNGNSSNLPIDLWERAKQLLDLMEALDDIKTLENAGHPPALRPHHLKGDMKGRIAIDIHKIRGLRITFVFENAVFRDVKIENYHK